jgi:hypothetical protein
MTKHLQFPLNGTLQQDGEQIKVTGEGKEKYHEDIYELAAHGFDVSEQSKATDDGKYLILAR